VSSPAPTSRAGSARVPLADVLGLSIFWLIPAGQPGFLGPALVLRFQSAVVTRDPSLVMAMCRGHRPSGSGVAPRGRGLPPTKARDFCWLTDHARPPSGLSDTEAPDPRGLRQGVSVNLPAFFMSDGHTGRTVDMSAAPSPAYGCRNDTLPDLIYQYGQIFWKNAS
jgi:hypothetical protein